VDSFIQTFFDKENATITYDNIDENIFDIEY